MPILDKPPDGYAQMIAQFGDIRPYIQHDGTLSQQWEADQIVRVDLPEPAAYAYDPNVTISRVTCHKLLADKVIELHDAIFKAGLWPMLGPYGGGFIYRANRNAGAKISTHAWGIAWDWDPVGFTNGSHRRRDPQLSAIIKSFGFVMGEDFLGIKDPMHAQYVRNY
jgi:hypothetical protein